MEKQFGPTKISNALIQLGLIMAALYLTNFYSYLLFHTLSEMVVVGVSIAVFMVAWNSRKYAENYFFLVLGIGFLFIGAIDLLHALAFKGMGVFPGVSTNLATQLWLAGRYLAGLAFLVAPLFIKRKVNPDLIFGTYFIIFLFLLSSVFFWKNFPIAYVDGAGLTPFKIVSEYVISAMLIAAVIILYYKRKEFDRKVYSYLTIALSFNIIAELLFTLYFVVTDIFNLLGHLARIAGIFFIYLGVVDISLTSPYRILFKNLKDNEVTLKNSHVILEKEVIRRTSDLLGVNKQLEEEVSRRKKIDRNTRATNSILKMFTKAKDKKEFISGVTYLIKQISGCSNVGLRILNNRGEVPYEVSFGFDNDFLGKESCLSLQKDQCMCSRIISGKPIESERRFLTVKGSFHCPNTEVFDKKLTVEERSLFRGECIKMGFLTLAVIPIIYEDKIIGAIHLADKKEGQIYAETFQLIESLTPLIGEGVNKFNLSEEVINLNSNLEEIVKTRTAELTKAMTELEKEIEEREKAQNRLKKYLQALENASDHVVITDDQGVIIYANKAVEKLTGYSKKEVLDQTPALWGNYLEKNLAGNIIEKVYIWDVIIGGKEEFEGEVTNMKKNGEKYVAQIHISPVRGEGREVLFFVAIERDITKMKELERSKDEFISLASHQLRTPLTSISLSAELLLRGVFGEVESRQKEYVKEIFSSTQRMSGLINSLLNVSRLELGTLQIQPQKINPIDVIDRVVEDLLPQINEKKIILSRQYGKIGSINFDQNIFRIIIENILNNALRYTPAKGEICIDLRRNDEEVIIKISDTGCGIPPEQADRIFDKSFRADNAKKISPDGIGLGLYMVKSVVEKTNSRIWFESELDKGTDFYLAMPAGNRK